MKRLNNLIRTNDYIWLLFIGIVYTIVVFLMTCLIKLAGFPNRTFISLFIEGCCFVWGFVWILLLGLGVFNSFKNKQLERQSSF